MDYETKIVDNEWGKYELGLIQFLGYFLLKIFRHEFDEDIPEDEK